MSDYKGPQPEYHDLVPGLLDGIEPEIIEMRLQKCSNSDCGFLTSQLGRYSECNNCHLTRQRALSRRATERDASWIKARS